MDERHLHIISFNIPYPPNFGGIIDVYYKIRALYNAGIKIHLHCFEYDRGPAPELESLCYELHYYQRKTGMGSAGSLKPYIVQSRNNEALIQHLLADDYPILFEGLHSCFFLNDPRLKKRFKIYRESNIEHQYYYNLFKAEKNPGPKIYYLIEAFKLRLYEKVLRYANLMLAVSDSDTAYLKKKFPDKKIIHLPSFHENDCIVGRPGRGDYVLYHGNLSVAENIRAGIFIAEKIAPFSQLPILFAGLNPDRKINEVVAKQPNITLVPNPTTPEMNTLITEAHAHLMVTFQATGLKLKLLNTIYQGRHIIANKAMYNGTVIGKLVHHAETADEFIEILSGIADIPYTTNEMQFRKETLNGFYSNTHNAQKLIELIFD